MSNPTPFKPFAPLQELKKRLSENLSAISNSIRDKSKEAAEYVDDLVKAINERDTYISDLEKQLLNLPRLEKQELHAVWTNTDTTEGRGMEYPFAICLEEATALRLAIGKGVQGSLAPVSKVKVFRFNNWIHAPVRVHQPTSEDLATQKKMDDANAVIAKARAAGLTDEDIKALRAQ